MRLDLNEIGSTDLKKKMEKGVSSRVNTHH